MATDKPDVSASFVELGPDVGIRRRELLHFPKHFLSVKRIVARAE